MFRSGDEAVRTHCASAYDSVSTKSSESAFSPFAPAFEAIANAFAAIVTVPLWNGL